ncbi:hypothetical protein GOODEAATRI_008892 [Goodea atripinnis]|uniref:Ras-GEF domain-containing protein n=1 Tax=Goodea atripinnis TaxID=208336 RepID=A0ABV0NAI3_9TELE
MEDYSEPQPSVFYQMPQSERIYEQHNKLFQEVYGFNDSFSSTDSMICDTCTPHVNFDYQRFDYRLPNSPPSAAAMEEAGSGLGLSMSVSNSYLIGQASLTTPTSESVNDEGGEGEYVNLYSSSQANGELPLSLRVTDDVLQDPVPQMPSSNSKESLDKERRQKTTETAGSVEEDVDELSLIDHKEIMSRITLKQEVSQDLLVLLEWSGDILLVHATETDRKGMVFKLSVSKIPTILVELTEDILKQLMDLVFTLVCNGELSLARVLRKNILDKVEQKKLLRYTNSLKPLAARGVSARVRSLIIQQEKAQDREKLLLKFIKIMKHLRKLNNFNSYLAILSALDSAPIRRLEWQKQTSEDLTFVHLGNPDLIDGKVNFSKRWQQFNILDSMRRFQQVHYELKRNEEIICFFNDFSDHLAEEALWELSLKIKPRNIVRRKTDREEKT